MVSKSDKEIAILFLQWFISHKISSVIKAEKLIDNWKMSEWTMM